MDTMTIREFIDRFAPCEEARLWLSTTQPDIETAWRTCTRSDWMLWALSKLRPLSELESVNLCCRFVRETPMADGRVVADLLTDSRSVAFLELKEAWVAGGGGPKPEGWEAAGEAAAGEAAAGAAWAARAAARWEAAAAAALETAWAAEEAAAAAAAGEAAAAGAAALAAWGDAEWAAWDAALAAALAAARKVQAGIIRSIVPDISMRLSQQ